MLMSIFVIIIGHRKRAVTPISIGATAPFVEKLYMGQAL